MTMMILVANLTDGYSHHCINSFCTKAMRRPPPPKSELYKHVLENDREYSWVMVFPNEEHER